VHEPGPAPGSFFGSDVSPPRFFVEAPFAAGGSIRLPERVAHHATRVLRLGDGAPIVLFDGRGGEWAARLQSGRAAAMALVEAFDPVERESPLRLTLLQALVAAEKLDWIVEKAVELGVARILVTATGRSVVRLEAARAARRLRHWADVACAACCQCGRNRIPPIEFHARFGAALDALPAGEPRLLLVPNADRDLFPASVGKGAVLAVGPEGGFADSELAQAMREGFVAVRLGPRVLRTETAALAALAALQTAAGDLAGATGRPMPGAS
jgi:16S rRNA (uracil1498-N3)-methyltransferase